MCIFICFYYWYLESWKCLLNLAKLNKVPHRRRKFCKILTKHYQFFFENGKKTLKNCYPPGFWSTPGLADPPGFWKNSYPPEIGFGFCLPPGKFVGGGGGHYVNPTLPGGRGWVCRTPHPLRKFRDSFFLGARRAPYIRRISKNILRNCCKKRHVRIYQEFRHISQPKFFQNKAKSALNINVHLKSL